jgi:PBP1b-binding outer membrane lipoprotein LpoB
MVEQIKKLFIVLLTAVFMFSCAAMRTEKEAEESYQLGITATVQSVTDREADLKVAMPVLKPGVDQVISDIAQQVVDKGLLIPGITIELDTVPVVVRETRGNIIRVVAEKPLAFPVGLQVSLKIPKKKIAIVDFEVIRGNQKEAGRVTLEGLTSALIDSGHFDVVERAKLQSLVKELELSVSGLMSESSSTKIGQLYMADLILTGTLAEMKQKWDINLRLINVRTGRALAAISMRTVLFKPSEMRDAGPMNENFEESEVDPSWKIGHKMRGLFHIGLDRGEGAEGSQQSLAITFNFKGENGKKMFARAENRKKRDLYLYRGVEFFVRSSKPITGHFFMLTSSPDDPNVMDAWSTEFVVDKEWRQVKIPFESLTIGRAWIKKGAEKYGAKHGDQILRLDRVELFSIGAMGRVNPPVKGKMKIDAIRFYQ